MVPEGIAEMTLAAKKQNFSGATFEDVSCSKGDSIDLPTTIASRLGRLMAWGWKMHVTAKIWKREPDFCFWQPVRNHHRSGLGAPLELSQGSVSMSLVPGCITTEQGAHHPFCEEPRVVKVVCSTIDGHALDIG